MIEIIKTKTSYPTIKYNNLYLHSKYDPIDEAVKFIEPYSKVLKGDIILIYGIGLGYHIEECLKKSNKNSKIVIFELNEELINICKEYNPSIFEKKRITIVDNNQEKFCEIFAEYLNLVDDIIIHRPSLETIKEEYKDMYNVIKWYKLNKENINRNSSMLINNYKSNIKENCMPIEKILNDIGNLNKPFLVLTSGPSLDLELENIKMNRKKFIIVSVGSSLTKIVKAGIKPDMFVLIDGQEIVYNQIKGLEKIGIPLCFLSTASKEAVSKYNGPKYIFYNESIGNNIVINTGKTVGAAALSIATKCCPKTIILIGQDLCLIDGKSHHSDIEKLYGIEDQGKFTKTNITIKDVNGREILTSETYNYFKLQIELIIRENISNIQFYNCSKGAFIEGAKNIEFKDVLKNI
ncbi:6-hydroxymethylpterin diphosphokinase MptE-like protein [Clostridium sp.]|uniref:motility associated factor glycosyltransferase family protein n=1 Tax=Clostridium sp. TaxID=1506 RepID=UPI003216F643